MFPLRARRPLLLLLALAVPVSLLSLAGTAQAEPFTPTYEAEYAAALAFWGVSSPPQCEEVRLSVLPTDTGATIAGDGGAAEATQPPPGVTYEWCELKVFADNFPTGACLQQVTMDHEVGHLLGYGHSEDITNVMYPSLQPEVWCPGEVPPTIKEPTTECRQTKRHPDGICLPAGSFTTDRHGTKKNVAARKGTGRSARY